MKQMRDFVRNFKSRRWLVYMMAAVLLCSNVYAESVTEGDSVIETAATAEVQAEEAAVTEQTTVEETAAATEAETAAQTADTEAENTEPETTAESETTAETVNDAAADSESEQAAEVTTESETAASEENATEADSELSSETEMETESESETEDVHKNIVTFQIDDGATVTVDDKDISLTDAKTSEAENGTIIFTVTAKEGYELEAVLVDGSIDARKNDQTTDEDDYIIEGIETDETVVTVKTKRLYPEQTFEEVKTANGVTVSATVEEGTFPYGTTMKVEDVTADYAIDKAQEAIGEEEEVVDAVGVDITFYDTDGTTVLQPLDESKVHVTMQLEEAIEGDNLSVVHVHDEENVSLEEEKVEVLEEQDIKTLTEDTVEFEASEFSIYIISGSTRTPVTSQPVTIEEGESIQVESSVSYTNGSWSSSDPTVASVSSSSGKSATITGVKASASPVTITYTYTYRRRGRNYTDTDSFTVTVTEPETEATASPITFKYYSQSELNSSNPDMVKAPANTVKFTVNLLDENGNLTTTVPGSDAQIPSSFTSSGSEITIAEILAMINVPGYTLEDGYAFFFWSGNQSVSAGLDLAAAGAHKVTRFKNFTTVSDRYGDGSSRLGTTSGSITYHTIGYTMTNLDGSAMTGTNWNSDTEGYYAYEYGGVLHIVLKPASQTEAYKTRWVNYAETGSTLVDTTNAHDMTYTNGAWQGKLTMTELKESDLTSPGEGYTFAGWYFSQDENGNGTGTKVEGDELMTSDNTVYAHWEYTSTDNTDTASLKVTKTFSGIEESEIPSNFTITVGSTTLSLNQAVKSGLIYTWTIDGVGAGTYNVSEDGETVANYTVETSGLGSVTVDQSGISLASLTRYTPNAVTSIPMGDTNIFVVSMTSSSGCAVITKNKLTARQRAALEALLSSAQGSWKTDNMYYYNIENQSNAQSFNTVVGTIRYDGSNITFSDKSQWSMVGTTILTQESLSVPDIAITNTYTRATTDIIVKKVVKGNFGDETRNFNIAVTYRDADNTVQETTLNLKNNETGTIQNVYIGSTISLTEQFDSSDYDGYSVSAVYGDSQQSGPSDMTFTVTTTENAADNVITVTNSKTVIPDTGINMDSLPYIVLVVIVVAGVVLLLVFRRRRRSED